jgi:hypothetical protein
LLILAPSPAPSLAVDDADVWLQRLLQQSRAPEKTGETPDRRPALCAVAATCLCLTAKRHTVDKKPVAPAVSKRVQRAVELRYAARSPLELVLPFGCYKHPSLPSAPEGDWAEYLHLHYMLARATDVAQVYPFGVRLRYVLLDLQLTELTGLPAATALRYVGSFRRLLDEARRHYPAVEAEASLLSGVVDREEYEARLGPAMDRVDRIWAASLPEWRAGELAKAARNRPCLAGDGQAQLERSAKLHLAVVEVLNELDCIRGPAQLPILLRKPGGACSTWLPLKSCRTSIVQFWVGRGCVVQRHGHTSLTILGRSQMAASRLVGHVLAPRPPAGIDTLRQVPIYEPLPRP